MNKKTIWTVVIAVALIVIAGVIWWNAKPAKAPEVNPGSSATTTPTGTASGTASAAASGTASGSGVTVTVKGDYSTGDYSFAYPSGWTISSYRPFSLTTFGGKYADGDVIPPGGAEIDIATTTIYNNLQSIIETELMSAKNVSMSTVTVNGTACAQATYENTYNGGVASKDIAVYCARGSKLWKIYLSYRADDTKGSAHVADFTSVLASMKLK